MIERPPQPIDDPDPIRREIDTPIDLPPIDLPQPIVEPGPELPSDDQAPTERLTILAFEWVSALGVQPVLWVERTFLH